jgi:NAD(P)H-nitrite reductase large subunit
VRYDRLLIATGSEPRGLDLPGAELDGVRYLRTIADANGLRERLQQGGQLVVISVGWIGMEVAASARQAGMDARVIAPEKLPLARALGNEIGTVYRDLHIDHGSPSGLATRSPPWRAPAGWNVGPRLPQGTHRPDWRRLPAVRS